MRWIPVALALVLATGCDTPEEEELTHVELLDARQQLIRLSVDLRGVHPSLEELDAIEANPELYDDFVDRYLADPRFLDRVEEIFNYRFLTRNGATYFDLDEAGLGGVDEELAADSIGDEPLKIIRHVVAEDLPWSQVVTADYTMADPIVAKMWGLDYPEDGEGWEPIQYTDGRPNVGVLSSTTMWQKYPSAGVNGNRHRANTVSRVFLCDDYLSRPVSFSRTQVDALTTGDPNEVISSNQTCQSCHSSLDPLAANFFGFWWEQEDGIDRQTTYRPEDEPMWSEFWRQSPAYFGRPTTGLEEMAMELAEDPRLLQCATRTVFEGLTQRSVVDADWGELDTHVKAFEDSGENVRAMVRSIVLSPEYRASKVLDEALAERVPTVKLVSPEQFSDIVAEKTGYRWQFRGRDGLARNARGLAVLAGGIDSDAVTTRAYDPSVGLVLIQERLSQAAGHHVAVHDLDPNRETDAILLEFVTIDDTPETSPEAFEAQIRELYLRITGVPLADDATEPEELMVVWKQLHSVEASPTSAWAGIISVVLRDPAVIFY